MTEHDVLVPVILSGGTGSRLWPISREAHPKPFIILPDGKSLLQKTFLRASGIMNTTEIITITNKEYFFKSSAEYEKTSQGSLGNKNGYKLSYLLEPIARNTGAAIALAAIKALETQGPNAILLILPADHLIENLPSFYAYSEKAIALAKENHLVTFGITPSYPETGYGYIECGKAIPSHETCHHVVRFVEKPDVSQAKSFLTSGQYLWNSGMFCFKADTVLQQLADHAPDLLNAAKQCWEISRKKNKHPDRIEFDVASFERIPSISIDYALMEKSSDIAVVACDYDWKDIGSWEAYKQLFQKDEQGNTVLGDAILLDSNDNFIHSQGRMIAAIGINNVAVIDTPDALLITDRHRTQDVKHIVKALKDKAHESYLTHRTVFRPWGSYTILEEGPCFKIKRIVVKPKAALSLQMHHHRSEHWVVIEGMAKIVNGDREQILKHNQSTFVPVETQHRLSNPGDTDLVIIEVQTGSYLGEDDIVRFEDTYGRI